MAPHFTLISKDLEVTEEDQVQIKCRVEGKPPPEVVWFMNGLRVQQTDRIRTLVNESGFHVLYVSKAELGDTGVVSCTAKNRSGETHFQVAVNLDPGISPMVVPSLESFHTETEYRLTDLQLSGT